MPYDVALTQSEYNRMVYVTLDCAEEKCGAVRGEPCRSLVHTERNDGFTKTPHFRRRITFTSWKKANPKKYEALLRQILAERCDEAATYETLPA